jgi:hypothetical protein
LCPLCTCPKEKVRDLGTGADELRRSAIRVDSEIRQKMVQKAREWIFKSGRAVTSEGIDIYLKFSMVPIRVMSSLTTYRDHTNIHQQNTFSEALCNQGFNFYQMFAVDLLHDFELGVWKGVFAHLIRILYACGEGNVHVLNER